MSVDTAPQHAEYGPRSKKEIIDGIVSDAADFLGFLDEVMKSVAVDEAKGQIAFDTLTKPLPKGVSVEFAQRYAELQAEFKERNEAYLIEVRQKPGILDAKLIAGCVVITIDSRQPFESSQLEEGRGEYHTASSQYLGKVVVDINPGVRKDSVTSTETMVHELHHHTLAINDALLSIDARNPMITGVRKGGNSHLFGRGQRDVPKTGLINLQSFTQDLAAYTALLKREITAADQRDIEAQQRYLDELHSSFLQRKPSWFTGKGTVYTTRGSGLHWELVGKNPDDQQSTKRLLALTQAVYIFEKEVVPAVLEVLKDRDREVSYLPDLLADFDHLAVRIGGVIGSARTVDQCVRLCTSEWQKFSEKYQEFFVKNADKFQSTVSFWQDSGHASIELAQLLLKK